METNQNQNKICETVSFKLVEGVNQSNLNVLSSKIQKKTTNNNNIIMHHHHYHLHVTSSLVLSHDRVLFGIKKSIAKNCGKDLLSVLRTNGLTLHYVLAASEIQ